MKSLIPFAVATLLISSPLAAQEFTASEQPQKKPVATPYNQFEGNYIDLGFGVVHAAATFGDDYQWESVDTGFAATASLGTYLNRYFSYELSLTHGRIDNNYTENGDQIDSAITANLIGPAIKAMLPLGDRITVSLKLGIGYELLSGEDTNVTQQTTTSDSDQSLMPITGIGVNVAINHQLECGIVYQSIAYSGFYNIGVITGGATYHF